MLYMYHFRRHLMLIVPLLVTLSLITWLQCWWPTLSRVKAHLPLVVNNRESVMRWVNWCLDSAAVLLPEALASNDSPAQCSDMCACLHRSRLRTLMLHLHWLSVDFPWVKCSLVSCERHATPRRNCQGLLAVHTLLSSFLVLSTCVAPAALASWSWGRAGGVYSFSVL